MKRPKIWGTTERLWIGYGIAADRIEILPGSFCSEHRHARKMNLFIVQSGEIEIRYWTPDGAPESHLLTAGKAGVVPPGFWHQFRSKTGAQVIEVCFSAAAVSEAELDADIERRTEGGRE